MIVRRDSHRRCEGRERLGRLPSTAPLHRLRVAARGMEWRSLGMKKDD
jgi:hypothetical protein